MFFNYTENISWVLLDDIVFVFEEIDNMMYVLEDIAKDFWLMIQDKIDFSSIIQKLSEIYDAEVEVIQDDMQEFVSMMISKKIIQARG